MIKEKTTETFTAASIQFNPEMYQLDSNLKALGSEIIRAANKGAKLVVTTEMVTTGYGYTNRRDIAPYVDTIPGKTTEYFTVIAKNYDVHIVIGMAEVDPETNIYYNASVLIGPEGLIGRYRKIHQWETELYWSAWGNQGVPVFDTKLGKIAMMICMDGAYMETARLAAVNGADILTFSTNSAGHTVALLQGRAEENGLYVISSNRANTEKGYHMVGASAIWNPEGAKLAESPAAASEADAVEHTTIIYGEIDPTLFRNPAKDRIKKERRTDVYKDLMLHIAPWNFKKNMTEHKVKAMALQYEVEALNKQNVMQTINKIMTDAFEMNEDLTSTEANINLVVLPELSLTGVIKNFDSAKDDSESLSGMTVDYFRALAIKFNTHIVFGMVERASDNLYNSAVCLNQLGELIGTYRKLHLTESDKTWAQPGSELNIVETDFGTLGIMIGYDAAFPEMSGLMAVKRADMIAIPSAWSGEFGTELDLNLDVYTNNYPAAHTNSIWHGIALNAQSYTIVSNFTGGQYGGGSALYTIDPIFGLDRAVVAPKLNIGALEVNFKTIQKDWHFNQEKLVASRRTDYYVPLVK